MRALVGGQGGDWEVVVTGSGGWRLVALLQSPGLQKAKPRLRGAKNRSEKRSTTNPSPIVKEAIVLGSSSSSSSSSDCCWFWCGDRFDRCSSLRVVGFDRAGCCLFSDRDGRFSSSERDLSVFLPKKSQLENQFVEADQSRKELELKIIAIDEMLQTFRQERELLQIDLESALQKAEEASRRKGDSSGTKYFSEFSMNEIAEATRNFDRSLKIGEGAFGSVYRGFLRHTPVAIKIMRFPGMQGPQEFQQEVDVLSEVRHPNLVTLIGACPKSCTLVYEYMPNGSLEDWLGSRNRAKQLPWRARIRIATELCSVLAFLHSCKPHSIVHGDVKAGTSYWMRTS
ncbi:hypothetical protein NL676_030553 [Syzygium grande]|nr:hypothetical protein NL676_030553 [Syzygium grande]